MRPDEGFVEVCEVVEVEDDSEEDFGPKIDLDLGTGSKPVVILGKLVLSPYQFLRTTLVTPLKKWAKLTYIKG